MMVLIKINVVISEKKCVQVKGGKNEETINYVYLWSHDYHVRLW